ncbi:MAG: hypothetical protein C0502_10735 [Opitutus sp.]|nr:hypothetical protein [Opitutus sp.]
MAANEWLETVHPAGEGLFTFPTAGGRVRVAVTDDALTTYGGLVPWAAFTKHLGVAASCPVARTSPNAAPVYDAIPSFMPTALSDGRRFSHLAWVREEPTIPDLFGLETVVGDVTVRRLFASVDPALGAEWIAAQARSSWGSCPD